MTDESRALGLRAEDGQRWQVEQAGRVSRSQGSPEMYEAFFGMNRRPFAALPQVDQYVAVGAMEQARTTLSRCVLRAEGIAMVVGPSGTGKTLLGLLLAAELGLQMRVVALPGGRFASPRALYQALLYELGKAYRGLDESEARLALNDYLLRDDDCSAGVLVLVDDAQCVGLRLLDELRALTNLGRAGLPLMRLVLIGNRLLEDHLSHPRLESLTQRITARCYLENMSRHETQQYIQTRVGYAGGNGPALFPEAACAAVHRATDGVARLVNQVCDHALLLAAARGCQTIDQALVEEAWADLQQLPAPWNEDAAPVAGANIEFGALDDDEPQPPADSRLSQLRPAVKQPSPADDARSFADDPDPGWLDPSMQEPRAGADADLEEPSREAKEFAAFSTPSAALPGPSTESFLDDDEDAAMRAEQEVDRIETYLSEVDDQFRPPGPKPEVELVFDAAHQPFTEPFAVEEEVPDRYVPRPHRPAPARSNEPIDSSAQPPPTVPLRPRTEPPDSVLIVEDGYGDPTPTPPCRVRPVRRSELANLFTRLRRGQ